MVRLVVGDLLRAVAVRYADKFAHGVRLVVGVEDDASADVPRGAPRRLHERGRGTQETLLVRVQYRDERHFGQVQSFAQEVDAHEHVELARAQAMEYLHAFDRVDAAVQILHANARLVQIVRQVFRAALGERRHEDAVAGGGGLADFADEIVDLGGQRANLDFRVQQARGPDDLLGDDLRLRILVVARGRRTIDDLPRLGVELLERERTVVLRAGQAEAVVYELLLARLVAVVHRTYLGDRHVAFVYDRQEIVREVVQQALGRAPRRAARQGTRIVLDAVAVSEFAHHFDVVLGPLAQTLRLQELAVRGEVLEAVGEFGLDAPEGGFHLVLAEDELLGGRHDRRGHGHARFAADRVQRADGVHLVAEELHAQGFRLVGGEDVHHVAAHAEDPRLERIVVARILPLDEPVEELLARQVLAGLYLDGEIAVFGGLPQAVDATDGRHHDDVLARDEGVRGRQAVALDLLVDRRVLLDVGIRLGNVRLGLVVVVVRDEVVYGVLGEKLLQFREELGGERLVVGQDERGTVPPGDEVRERERLAAPRHALEDEAVVAARETVEQFVDGLRLVPRRLERGDELEKPVRH